MTKNWQRNYSWKKIKFFGIKTTIYLSLGLHKERPSYWRSLQLSKEAIQHFKSWHFLIFFYFCGSFLTSWIRIHWPDWIRANPDKNIRIRILNTAYERVHLIYLFSCTYSFSSYLTIKLWIMQGWDQGLVGMCAGEKRKLVIPPHLG